MMNSGDSTHRPRAIDPQNFRAQATGIGQSLLASRATGLLRAERVVGQMPPNQRAAVPVAEGYPGAPRPIPVDPSLTDPLQPSGT